MILLNIALVIQSSLSIYHLTSFLDGSNRLIWASCSSYSYSPLARAAVSIQQNQVKYSQSIARGDHAFAATFKDVADRPIRIEETKSSPLHHRHHLNARKAHFKRCSYVAVHSKCDRQNAPLNRLVGCSSWRTTGDEKKVNIRQFVAGEIIIITIINSVEKIILSLQTIYDLLTGLESSDR